MPPPAQLRLHFDPMPPRAEDNHRDDARRLEAPLFVRHRRARRYVLRLTVDGRPRVTIPRGGSRQEAERFLVSQADWLARERRRHAARCRHEERAWTTGDRIWIRGVLARVQVAAREGGCRVACGPIALPVGDGADVKTLLERHLRSLAAAELPARLTHLAGELGLSPGRVTVRGQRTRWGSCSPSGAISLNWRLVQMPDEVRDYVLIHELMHLRVANHSRRFWRLVQAACPWHVEARRWLRRHGRDLHQPVSGEP